VRELVYLSERKLRQFQDERPKRWFRRVKEIGFKAPFGVGEAKVALADESASAAPNLDRVLRELDKSDRAPKWFEDETVSTGDWVTFEARLNYLVWPDKGALVLFVQPPDQEPTPVRMLMQGSSVHVLECSQTTPIDIESQAALFGSSMLKDPGWLQFFFDNQMTGAAEDIHGDPRHSLIFVEEEVRRETLAETACWMAGLARVTYVGPVAHDRGPGPSVFMLATPLYVEYVCKPSDEELGGDR
jgi:hypothetical protein